MEPKAIQKACRALGDENRMRVFLAICDTDEICACKLLKSVACAQSTLSHHLKILVEANLVFAREDGKWTHYSANRRLMQTIGEFFERTAESGKDIEK